MNLKTKVITGADIEVGMLPTLSFARVQSVEDDGGVRYVRLSNGNLITVARDDEFHIRVPR